jgi:hypothetical protein
VTAEEALHAVQDAMAARGLPGGSVGLRTADRTFIAVLGPAHLRHRTAITELLTAMGCEVSVNGFVYGKVTGKLLPAPELPPVPVRSADSCSAAELTEMTVTAGKVCRGPCGEFKPLDSFSLNGRTPEGRQRRMHWCRPCHAAQQRERHAARMAAPAV